MFYLGLDLGQVNDFTALTIIDHKDDELHVRYLWRERNHPYPAIVKIVQDIAQRPEIATNSAALVIDATGVGRPVVDMFRELENMPQIVPITITGGDSVSPADGSGYRVPKRDLVSTMQIALQAGELKFADRLRYRDIVMAEFLNFKAKISAKGHDSYAAGGTDWREGEHDDIVLAVSLACWYIMRQSLRVAMGTTHMRMPNTLDQLQEHVDQTIHAQLSEVQEKLEADISRLTHWQGGMLP